MVKLPPNMVVVGLPVGHVTVWVPERAQVPTKAGAPPGSYHGASDEDAKRAAEKEKKMHGSYGDVGEGPLAR
jgi:hypothetical protein